MGTMIALSLTILFVFLVTVILIGTIGIHAAWTFFDPSALIAGGAC